jgi:large subunit ribosomal protein L21
LRLGTGNVPSRKRQPGRFLLLKRLSWPGQTAREPLDYRFYVFSGEQFMYAVFSDGSRQYRVQEGDVVRVDYRDVPEGERITFERVLLLQTGDGLEIGQPVVAGARVLGEVVDHPSIKVYVQHFRKRKNYRRLRGHRQPYTAVRIRNLLAAGQEPPAQEKASAPAKEKAADTAAS